MHTRNGITATTSTTASTVTAATNPTPSDIVASLMFYTGTRFIASDPEKLHGAILMAKEICPLLGRFTFSTSDATPMSRSFDHALSILKLSRVVRMENTDYKRYILDDEARSYVESHVLPLFSDDEKRLLEKAAAIVREACEGSDPVATFHHR